MQKIIRGRNFLNRALFTKLGATYRLLLLWKIPHVAEGMRAVGGNSLNEYEGKAVIREVDTDVHTRD